MIEAADRFMERAVELSRRGFPAPNPHVGCVLVRDGEIVGEGWHEYAGTHHAEAAALLKAGAKAKGAEAYVTQEPCAHHGRTPPCADALISAGVTACHIALPDPNPIGAGGAKRLAEAGIEVTWGSHAEEAAQINRFFRFRHLAGRPYVTVKAAITLDGRIAKAEGVQTQITGPEAVAEGHQLRAEMGSVLVGRKTVATDDPLLTARIEGVVNQPFAVVLDPKRKLSGKERVLQRDGTLWLTADDLPTEDGRFAPEDVLKRIGDAGAIGVLIEGGAETASAFLKAGLCEQIDLFVAPKAFGSGPIWSRVGLKGDDWSFEQPRMLGADAHLRANRDLLGTILP